MMSGNPTFEQQLLLDPLEYPPEGSLALAGFCCPAGCLLPRQGLGIDPPGYFFLLLAPSFLIHVSHDPPDHGHRRSRLFGDLGQAPPFGPQLPNLVNWGTITGNYCGPERACEEMESNAASGGTTALHSISNRMADPKSTFEINTHRVWVPDDVKTHPGIIVNQHGCGEVRGRVSRG